MDHHAEGCLVRDFEPHIGSFGLPDPDDEHVLAAAVVSGADSIVTWNGRDFPAEILGPLGIAVVTPDEMAASLLKDRPEEVCAAVRETRLSLKNPPKSIDEYLEILRWRGLIKTSGLLASFHRDL